jgi:methyl-accepting chemotaxis protein
VVADADTKLAERTQNSTTEISTIITSLQKESGAASQEMDGANASVDQGLTAITETDESFVSVVSSVEEIVQTTMDINRNITEQVNMIETVNGNTQSIASGIEESVTAVNEVTITVAHLQRQAEKLKMLVSQFRV